MPEHNDRDGEHAEGIIRRCGENRQIGDLGLATLIKTGGNVGYAGTPSYFSPEILKEKLYDEKVDVWALGCVLYYLAAQHHPFESEDYATLNRNILHKEPKALPR